MKTRLENKADTHLVVESLEVLGSVTSRETKEIRRTVDAVKKQSELVVQKQDRWYERFSDDGVISTLEKTMLKREFENIRRSYAAVYTQAEQLGYLATLIVRDYIATYEALRVYLYNTLKLFDNMEADTEIPDRSYFNQMFSNYYYSESFTLIAINREIAATLSFRVLESLDESGEENEVALYMGGIYMYVNGVWQNVTTGAYKGALDEIVASEENAFFLASDNFIAADGLYINGEPLLINGEELSLSRQYEKGYIYFCEDNVWHKDEDLNGYRYVAAFADVITVTGRLPALFQQAIDDLQEQIDDAVTAIGNTGTSLAEEIATRQGQYTIIDGEIVRIDGRIEGVISRVGANETAITGLEDATATIQNNVTSISGRVTDVEGDLDGVDLALSGLTADTSDIHTTLEDVDDTLDDISVDIGDVHLDLSGISDDTHTIETTINGMNVLITGLNDNIPGINVDITNIKSGVENINTNITGLQNAVVTINGNITSISGRVTDVEGDLDGVGLALDGLTADTDDIHTQLTDVDDTLDDISVDIGDVHLDLSGISDDTHTIETTINGMNVLITGLNDDIPGINVDITNIKSGVENINTNITGLQDAVVTINDSITSITGRITDVERDMDGVEFTLSGLTADTSDIHTTLEDVDDTLDDISVDIGDVHLDLSGISDDTHTIETTINGMNVLITGLNDDIPGINVDITNIKSGVQGINSAISSLQTDVAGKVSHLPVYMGSDNQDPPNPLEGDFYLYMGTTTSTRTNSKIYRYTSGAWEVLEPTVSDNRNYYMMALEDLLAPHIQGYTPGYFSALFAQSFWAMCADVTTLDVKTIFLRQDGAIESASNQYVKQSVGLHIDSDGNIDANGNMHFGATSNNKVAIGVDLYNSQDQLMPDFTNYDVVIGGRALIKSGAKIQGALDGAVINCGSLHVADKSITASVIDFAVDSSILDLWNALRALGFDSTERTVASVITGYDTVSMKYGDTVIQTVRVYNYGSGFHPEQRITFNGTITIYYWDQEIDPPGLEYRTYIDVTKNIALALQLSNLINVKPNESGVVYIGPDNTLKVS